MSVSQSAMRGGLVYVKVKYYISTATMDLNFPNEVESDPSELM